MNEYATAHESVTRQLRETITTNWLAGLDGQDLWTAHDLLIMDSGSIRKRVERGKITNDRVVEIAIMAENLKILPGLVVRTLIERVR